MNYFRNEHADTLDVFSIYRRKQFEKESHKEDLATSIKLEPKLEYMDDDTLVLTFKIGTKKMYILKNINTLYTAYKNQEVIEYGKQLRFVPNRDNFTEETFISKMTKEEILDLFE